MNQPLSQPGPDKDEPSLVDFLIVLVKYSRTIIFATLAATVLTYLYLFSSANSYQATARLLPPQQNLTMVAQLLETLGGGVIPGKTGGSGGMGSIGSLLGLKSPSDFYVGLLTSDSVMDRVIEQFNLLQVYKVQYLEQARDNLRKKAAAFRVGKTDGIITVTVTDLDRERCAAIANAFVDGLDKLLQMMVAQEAKGRLVFLENELTKANLNLAKTEEALRTFSEKNSVIQIDTQTRGTLEYVARLRAEIDTKEVQIRVLRYQATPRNAEMIRLEMELNGLKENLQAVECNQVPGSDICLTTSKVPTLGMEYIRLYREVKFQEGLYHLYTKMVEMARVDMVRDVAVVQLIDRAKPPGMRSNKRLGPTLLSGMVFFVLMVIGVWCREVWETNRSQRASARWTLLLSYLEPWRQNGKRILSLFKRKKF
jgi:tyrosine-protein kinase Etk/Wzc